MSLTEDLLLQSSDVISHRFLMLIQAVSGIRGLTMVEGNSLDEAKLLEEVLTVLLQNLDLDSASIFLLEGDWLYCAIGKDWDDHVRIGDTTHQRRFRTFRIGEGVAGIAAKNRRLYHCKNCRTDSNYLSVVDSTASKRHGSLISAPVMIGKELLGILNVSHPEPNFFHAWQEHIVTIHANILAQMLHNHRLMKNMRQEVQKRTYDLEHALAEAESLKLRYQSLSMEDELTHLPNRRYFFSESHRAIAQANRYKMPLSLLLLDIDHFKQVNDTHGHEKGDLVLRDLGTLLREQIRDGDIVARLGGEEFVFILTGTRIEGASEFSERIRTAISSLHWQSGDEQFQITVSIGATDLHQEDETSENTLRRLLKEADTALYHSKTNGRDQATTFDSIDDEG